MKKIRSFKALISSLKLQGCTLLLFAMIPNQSVLALEGGQLATSGESSGIIGISYKSSSIKNCIGVLLQPNRVLTTVGCLKPFGSTSIDADDFRIHPLSGSEIGGTSLPPVLNEGVTPFVGVDSVVIHPQNDRELGPYSLAILRLSTDLESSVASIYGGSNNFVGRQATAFGWREFVRPGTFLDLRYYEANTITLPAIVDGDSDIDSIGNGCYDDFVDTDTVFCAGFKDGVRFLQSDDEGAPLLSKIANQDVVIGLLSDASGGFEFDGEFAYEEFARISAMREFIQAEAPDTVFVNEITPVNPPVNPPPSSDSQTIAPIINLLLDE